MSKKLKAKDIMSDAEYNVLKNKQFITDDEFRDMYTYADLWWKENRVKINIGVFFYLVFVFPLLVVLDWFARHKEARLG